MAFRGERAFFLLLPVLGCACGVGGEAADEQTSEIVYKRAAVVCTLSATEQDIDDPAPLQLGAITASFAWTYGRDDDLLATDPALQQTKPPSWQTAQIYRIFRSTMTDGVVQGTPPLGFSFAERLQREQPLLVAVSPKPSGMLTRDFVHHDDNGWDDRPLEILVFGRYSNGVRTAVEAKREIWRVDRGASAKPGIRVTLSDEDTAAVLRHLGTTRLTSPNLKSVGALTVYQAGGCVERQTHLPPDQDNGLSFHIELCCR